jgi:hypothetical protein
MAAPAERADTTARSLWRQALVRSGSLGRWLPGRWPWRRADSSQPRHQASESSGQTQARATTEIIAVNASRAWSTALVFGVWLANEQMEVTAADHW